MVEPATDVCGVETVVVDLAGSRNGLLGAVFRYEVMDRLSKSAASRGVAILAFGFCSDALRLVLEGGAEDVKNVLRGLKVGTIRAAERWGVSLRTGPTIREAVADGGLLDAVAWAHRAPIEAGANGPLASPWSSHRDVLGFRRASFYDPSVLAGRIDPNQLQRRCGGDPLPSGWPPAPGREDLSLLLRIAGSVLGVLPADRRCFRLFVHLAKARGWATIEVARALSITTRRVRQLAAELEPTFDVAMMSLADPQLSRVP